MMVTRAAGVIWCVGPTTASSSEPTITRRMTAVRDLPKIQQMQKRRHQEGDLPSTQIFQHSSDLLHFAAPGERLTRVGAALRLSPAWRARATVTGTRSARAAWCVGTTTADSLERSSMKKMTVV